MYAICQLNYFPLYKQKFSGKLQTSSEVAFTCNLPPFIATPGKKPALSLANAGGSVNKTVMQNCLIIFAERHMIAVSWCCNHR